MVIFFVFCVIFAFRMNDISGDDSDDSYIPSDDSDISDLSSDTDSVSDNELLQDNLRRQYA